MKKQFITFLVLLFVALGAWADPSVGDPIATIGSPTVTYGVTTVDVPITVSNLSTNSIGSFSLKFRFDPTYFSNPSILSRNAAFDAVGHVWDGFSYTTNTDTLNAGSFKVTALSLADPITLPSGTGVIFTLRFTVKSAFIPSVSPQTITFSENGQGTSCEFTGPNNAYVPYTDFTTTRNDGIEGSGASNHYYFHGHVTMNRKALTMSGLSIPASKVYNANTVAVVTDAKTLQSAESKGNATVSDGAPYSGDAVSITGTPAGTYASKDVANNIVVTYSGLSLTGGQAANYNLTIQPATTANITAKALTVEGITASTQI